MLTLNKKLVRDVVCEEELKNAGNSATMSQDEIEWQCKFQKFFNEEAVDYLKSCGCFDERDWKKNFKALSLHEFHSECSGYSYTESAILQAKTMRNLNMYLGDLSIPRLPPTIGGLSHLSNLYLFNIDTHSLPDELGDLKSLKSLTIKNLPIHSLPQKLTKLGLIQLYITGTLIHKFELELESTKLAKTLKELMIQNNKILELNHSFSNLNLERLDISGNIGLQCIPASTHQSSLVWVNVSQTSLDSLPNSVFSQQLTLLTWKNNLVKIHLPEIADQYSFKLEWYGSNFAHSPHRNTKIQFVPSM